MREGTRGRAARCPVRRGGASRRRTVACRREPSSRVAADGRAVPASDRGDAGGLRARSRELHAEARREARDLVPVPPPPHPVLPPPNATRLLLAAAVLLGAPLAHAQARARRRRRSRPTGTSPRPTARRSVSARRAPTTLLAGRTADAARRRRHRLGRRHHAPGPRAGRVDQPRRDAPATASTTTATATWTTSTAGASSAAPTAATSSTRRSRSPASPACARPRRRPPARTAPPSRRTSPSAARPTSSSARRWRPSSRRSSPRTRCSRRASPASTTARTPPRSTPAADRDIAQAQAMIGFLASQGATVADLTRLPRPDRLAAQLRPQPGLRRPRGDRRRRPDRHRATAPTATPTSTGPDPSHGTGVAGLIAAVRGNGIGIDGIAPNTAEAQPVRIMALRDGARRRRARQGRRQRDPLRGRQRRADHQHELRQVVLAAEERRRRRPSATRPSAACCSSTPRATTATTSRSRPATTTTRRPTTATRPARTTRRRGSRSARARRTWTRSRPASRTTAQTRVDLFAPGATVTSLAPGGGVQTADGTSFASPVTAGVAALVMAYFPTSRPCRCARS